jgi:hypothetical protein
LAGEVVGVTEYVVIWKDRGYQPLSDGAIESLSSGDAEPALRAMRSEALIVKVPEHEWESLK